MKDGGTAFPVSRDTDANGEVVQWASDGMSLRDYFAAKAMQSLITTISAPDLKKTPQVIRDGIVQGAYMMADAMIAERQKNHE